MYNYYAKRDQFETASEFNAINETIDSMMIRIVSLVMKVEELEERIAELEENL